MDINEVLMQSKLLPIITLKSKENIEIVKEVIEGSNIKIVEVAFRSEFAAQAIREYSSIEGVIIGAGTIRTVDEAQLAIDSGAKFLVSPMYETSVVKCALKNNTPILPGVMTPSEIQKGISEAGLSIFKLFPANLIGGINAIKALQGPFYDVKFLPTGGVTIDNYLEFLSNENIIAVGGSFILNDSIDYSEINKEIEKVNRLLDRVN